MLNQEFAVSGRYSIPIMQKYIIDNNCKKVLELGTCNGVSTLGLIIALIKTGGHLWSVDPDSCAVANERVKTLGLSDYWTFTQMNDLDYEFNDLADMIFIDTSHEYAHTLMELEKYSLCLKAGSSIFLHDTLHPIHCRDVVGAISHFMMCNIFRRNLQGQGKWTYFEHGVTCGLGELRMLSDKVHNIVPMPWATSYTYDDHWGYTSYKDKVVLDLGADIGSTASYFFQKGAKKVICVESYPEWWPLLIKNYGNDPDAVCLKIHISNPEQIRDLINQYSPDIVKVDIEGDEKHLLGLDRETLRKVPEYLVETHCPKLEEDMNKFLNEHGHDSKTVWTYDENTKVILAKRSIIE